MHRPSRFQAGARGQTERFLKDYAQDKPASVPRFYLLNARPTGFEIEGINLTRPAAMSTQDLELHYGAQAVGFEQALVDSLGSQASGAVILRGEPGTGKTSFIRHLISKLKDSHKFYYLPVSACRFLASPDMVEFWLRQSRLAPELGKIVVLEDAEDLLMERETDNQAKVSSLLNAADGLLGEFLRLSLILTVSSSP